MIIYILSNIEEKLSIAYINRAIKIQLKSIKIHMPFYVYFHLLNCLYFYSMEGGELFSRIQEKSSFNEQGERKFASKVVT